VATGWILGHLGLVTCRYRHWWTLVYGPPLRKWRSPLFAKNQQRLRRDTDTTCNYTVSQKNRTRLLCLITSPKIEQYQWYLTQVIVHPRLILWQRSRRQLRC